MIVLMASFYIHGDTICIMVIFFWKIASTSKYINYNMDCEIHVPFQKNAKNLGRCIALLSQLYNAAKQFIATKHVSMATYSTAMK